MFAFQVAWAWIAMRFKSAEVVKPAFGSQKPTRFALKPVVGGMTAPPVSFATTSLAVACVSTIVFCSRLRQRTSERATAVFRRMQHRSARACFV